MIAELTVSSDDYRQFQNEFKKKLLETLNLTDIEPENISDEITLFKGGLGLDSIDAIEIVIMIEKEYNIIMTPAERNETVFKTFGNLSEFVFKNRGRDNKKSNV